MELTLRHLQVLCVVAERGSIGRAAAQLGISQPALTGLLRRIEAQVGCQVFDRTASGVSATRPGRQVLVEAGRVLDAMHQFRNAHGPADSEPETVRVGGHGPLLLQLVQELALETERPLAVRTQKSSRLLQVELEKGLLDYAVVREYPTTPVPAGPAVSERELLPLEPLFVGMARTHRLADLPYVPLGELRDESWAMDADDDSGENQMLAQACQDLAFLPRPSLVGDDNGVARSWVGSGRAVALFEARAAQDHELVVRPLQADPVYCRLSLRWPADAHGAGLASDVVFDRLVRVYARAVRQHLVYHRWWQRSGSADGPVAAALDRSGPA